MDEFIGKMTCSLDIMEMRLFPNAKEVRVRSELLLRLASQFIRLRRVYRC